MKKEVIETFNPWEVPKDINYDKLVKEFGVSELKTLPNTFNKELLFRRKIIFSHRDIQKILEAVKNKKPFYMLTGLMPTGKFHIGHLVIARQMVFWQNLGAKVYIAVADVEAYNVRNQPLSESRKIAEDYIKNYIALGLQQKNCEIYFQSNRSKDSKKSNSYYRLQNLAAKNLTFNEFKTTYGHDITPGKIISSLLQSSDILHPQLSEFSGQKNPVPVIVPVGIDQDPHLRLTRDISQRIKEYRFISPSSTYNLFVPGLKGGKMSSSDSTSFISTEDDEKAVKNKINKYAFSGGKDTLEEHKKHGGNPDIDVSYQYLKFFFEEDDKKLKEIEENYKSGKLTTGQLKTYTINKINAFLKEHQKKLKSAEKQIGKYIDN